MPFQTICLLPTFFAGEQFRHLNRIAGITWHIFMSYRFVVFHQLDQTYMLPLFKWSLHMCYEIFYGDCEFIKFTFDVNVSFLCVGNVSCRLTSLF